jgi:nucleotide-binding universal stress UspA family protein
MYSKILVPLDGSKTANRGLEEAIGLARVHKARLCLLNVLDDYPLMAEMSSAGNFEHFRNTMMLHGEELLAKAKRTALDQGTDAQTRFCEAGGGRVADIILQQARELGCDLIVMGTHGRRGVSHLMMGSDAELVVRGSTVPVLLVREPS